LAIFSRPHLATTIRGCLLALGLHGGYYAIATWLPTYLRTERHLSVLSTGGYLAVIILGSFVGYFVAAHLNDTWGRRKTFLLYAVASLAIAFSYMIIPMSNGLMLVLGFPLGFFASGIYSGSGRCSPNSIRRKCEAPAKASASTSAGAWPAAFPVLIGSLSGTVGLGGAIGLFATLAYGLVIVVVLGLPETRGRELALTGRPLTVHNSGKQTLSVPPTEKGVIHGKEL
jgi:MFS family permease